jgi:hypothetical protein
VVIGLKLLAEVMITRKNDPLFEPLRSGALSAFAGNVKGLNRAKAEAE